ncbi:MAG: YihY/virulence factor BrkB family protein [Acidobacteriaceae bacterium]|nr:YihY/virulence factor BrkB family protein [Acidobacteriaceae bacterium]MBV9498883.1 YihY/virulence factor BrkB family protein [Acidobacteriaceae bacterium]
MASEQNLENPKIVYEANGTEVATQAGGARRYRKPFLRFRWRDIWCLLQDSFGEWNKQNATRLGASLAFYSLLSLAPLLLLTVSIVGLAFGQSTAEHHITYQIESLVGPAAAKAATEFLHTPHVKTHGAVGTVLGVITLLFSASGVVIELRQALNYIWGVPTPDTSGLRMVTSFIKERLFSFAMVLSFGFLLLVSLAITTWITELTAHEGTVSGLIATLFHVANIVVSFLVVTGLFAAIYKVMPDVHLEWRDVILGGAVTSLLFTIGKFLLGLYLGRAAYSSMYGATASVIVLIAWIYYSAQIFFLGAEFTKAFAHRYGSRPKHTPEKLIQEGTAKPADPGVKVVAAGS